MHANKPLHPTLLFITTFLLLYKQQLIGEQMHLCCVAFLLINTDDAV